MSEGQPKNGYITVSTLVSAFVGVALAEFTLGGVILSRSLDTRDVRLDHVERRLSDDESKIVPWQVHQEKWNAQAAQDSRLQAEIDETNKRIGDAYSLGDALKHMQEQLDKLRDGKEK